MTNFQKIIKALPELKWGILGKHSGIDPAIITRNKNNGLKTLNSSKKVFDILKNFQTKFNNIMDNIEIKDLMN